MGGVADPVDADQDQAEESGCHGERVRRPREPTLARAGDDQEQHGGEPQSDEGGDADPGGDDRHEEEQLEHRSQDPR